MLLNRSPNLQLKPLLKVIRRTEWNFDKFGLQYKPEFCEVSGNFEMGRIVTSKELSRKVQSNPSAQELWMSRFGDQPPARIETGSDGASNLFVFAPNDTCHLTLVDNEVEIRVQAMEISLANHKRTIRKPLGEDISYDKYANEFAKAVSSSGGNSGLKSGHLVCGFTAESFKHGDILELSRLIVVTIERRWCFTKITINVFFFGGGSSIWYYNLS
ncbi:hypothetical protein BOTCAL_0173g00070 [Botryotinia calthae]|uniref:Uncharacterized protein n=1 Tax=Botryotinia calthae TaxID=38488 RepID=A0A4Y8D3M2_9HELO|nr:hypothetical protein BOTCAL_0173g00070 [Botryotinia calthae]